LQKVENRKIFSLHAFAKYSSVPS